MPVSKVKKKPTIKCMKCGQDIGLANFFLAKNPKYSHVEYIPFCKDCIVTVYEEFYKEEPDQKMAMVKLCSYLDIPFAENIFDMALSKCVKEKLSVARAYMSFINSAVGKNKGVAFKDSEIFIKLFGNTTREAELIAENESLRNDYESINKEYSKLERDRDEQLANYKRALNDVQRLVAEKEPMLNKITALTKKIEDYTQENSEDVAISLRNLQRENEELINKIEILNGELDEYKNGKYELVEDEAEEIPEEYSFEWGDGFTLKDYEYLEKELEVFKRTHKSDNESEETLLREICITKLDLRNARASGDDTRVANLRKMLQDLMKTCAIDPAKTSAASSGKMLDAFGVWVKDLEETRPAEWVEDKTLFKDVDNISDYLKKYITRPIKNFITGSRDFGVDTDFVQKE